MTDLSDLLILGIGVSPEKNDGVLRFEHYCNMFNLPYQILGHGKKWNGGDMEAGIGGGQKINELLKAIESMDNKLLIVCDTFDVIPIAGIDEIKLQFNRLTKQNQILFSSEIYCWPNKSLASLYPKYESKYSYLNSGGFMGYRDDIYDLIKDGMIKDNSDDQYYFTMKYLANPSDNNPIILDSHCELFQTLGGSCTDIVLHKNRVYNHYTNSYPIFIHGNGPSKLYLNYLENYIGTTALSTATQSESSVFFAVYIDSSSCDISKIINQIKFIRHESKTVYLYDRSYSDTNKESIELHGYIYKSNVTTYVTDDFINSNCEYYFLLEQHCYITKPDILQHLIPLCNGYHRIIAPMLCRTKSLYSNFWGALDNKGFYKRSDDYLDLVNKKKRGLWNMPYISGAILISKQIISNWDITQPNKYSDVDMQLCNNFRKNTLFMYVSNLEYYGYIE